MGNPNWPDLLSALLRDQDLSTAETTWAMDQIMSGSATSVQIAGFAVALRGKGETPAEVAGMVAAMLRAAAPIDIPEQVRAGAVDVVGTGGDRAQTVNISTMAALVVAGAGVPVVKHGNRAASSACGAADVLEELGLPMDLSPAGVARCVAEAGIGFCFAPVFHAGLRHASVARRELGVPTAFNFLGPLTNPARPRSGTVGCADTRMAGVLARVFAERGDSVLVVRGEDGLDEFTTAAPTRIWVVAGGEVTERTVDALDLGLPRSQPGDLRGADATYNAGVVRRVLAGEPGPVRDAVLVNAAAALVAHQAGRSGSGRAAPAAGIAEALRDALRRAADAVDTGSAAAALDRWLGVARGIAAAG